MSRQPEVVALHSEIRSRLYALRPPYTASARTIRREISRRLAEESPEFILALALELITDESDLLRFFAYELVSLHKRTAAQLTQQDLLKLAAGMNSWAAVDTFALYLSGPMWTQGRLPDETLIAWTQSEDRWWRRAALVTTVLLSRRANPTDGRRITAICALLASDQDDMVVKALSWAIRELTKKHPEQARLFLATHASTLAPRVAREVNNKLRTGLKTPRKSPFGNQTARPSV
jgi:3-methyladenine DNA glycosylase AlkD